MFEKILLPLDGSELAEVVLPYGEELATRLGSEVILFHVCRPENKQFCHMNQVYLDGMAEAVRRRMMKRRAKSREVKVKSEVLLGEPVETICDYVEKNDIGLMIMGASGASGFKLWRLGSITDKVFRTVPIPAMLIRAQKAKGRKKLFNRILLPLDGSDASKAALPVAEELATKLKASVTLFRMARRTYIYGQYGEGEPMATIDYTKLDAVEEKLARDYLINTEKELRQKDIAVTHNVVFATDPANEIIELGKRVNADLVVMSTRGRSPIGRWVFGSTAEKVLRQGEIPLILVRR